MKRMLKIVAFISVGLASSHLFGDAASQAQSAQGALDIAKQAVTSRDVLSKDQLQAYLTTQAEELTAKIAEIQDKIKALQNTSIPGKDTIIATLNAVTQGLSTKLQDIKIDLRAPTLEKLQGLYDALSMQLADYYVEQMNADMLDNPKEREIVQRRMTGLINELEAVMTLVKDKINALR
jgi:hypothetical protein